MQGRQNKSESDADNKGTLGQSFVNWANAGILGFHMISGPLLGIFLGYYLDKWLDSKPVCMFVGMLLGLVAGGLNVYRDVRRILREQAAADAREKLLRLGRPSTDSASGGKPGSPTADNTPGGRDGADENYGDPSSGYGRGQDKDREGDR